MEVWFAHQTNGRARLLNGDLLWWIKDRLGYRDVLQSTYIEPYCMAALGKKRLPSAGSLSQLESNPCFRHWHLVSAIIQCMPAMVVAMRS